jgi:lipoprotein-anchoring transpeptidase ErfK/SrfK
VSTGKKGVGTVSGSEKTPFGTHRIKEKMGQGEKLGTILVGEGNKNGTVTQIISEKADTPFDYVTTRLLRLDGQESGINRGGANDSHSRDIYIHGTPEEGLLGTPASHGCIRMKNSDIIALFDLLPSGTLVEILPKEFEPTPAMLSKTK